jgi:hypothetical protein
MSAYAAFVQEQQPHLRAANPGLTFREMSVLMGSEWKKLDEINRARFVDIANNDKDRYMREKEDCKQRYMERLRTGETPDMFKRKGSKRKSRLAPKNPMSGYTCFVRDVRADVKKECDGKSFAELAAIVGAMWKNLSPEKRVEYDKAAEQDKKRYELEKARYNLKIQQIQSQSQSTDKRIKKRMGPRRAISAYTFYVMEQRSQLGQHHPALTFKEAAQQIGLQWRNLSEDHRVPYKEKAKDDKERYEIEKEAFY